MSVCYELFDLIDCRVQTLTRHTMVCMSYAVLWCIHVNMANIFPKNNIHFFYFHDTSVLNQTSITFVRKHNFALLMYKPCINLFETFLPFIHFNSEYGLFRMTEMNIGWTCLSVMLMPFSAPYHKEPSLLEELGAAVGLSTADVSFMLMVKYETVSLQYFIFLHSLVLAWDVCHCCVI